jgi:hypothetical protein
VSDIAAAAFVTVRTMSAVPRLPSRSSVNASTSSGRPWRSIRAFLLGPAARPYRCQSAG